ncbi:hypothetical protein WL99_31325 [Burkholderia cepacia]|nr:hypothetical protein WL99_31325 [Burkholderia cepacia]
MGSLARPRVDYAISHCLERRDIARGDDQAVRFGRAGDKTIGWCNCDTCGTSACAKARIRFARSIVEWQDSSAKQWQHALLDALMQPLSPASFRQYSHAQSYFRETDRSQKQGFDILGIEPLDHGRVRLAS